MLRKYKNFRFLFSLNTLIKITLLQFRNYTSAIFPFESRITCITGPNGSGKTNLLDAVYYLCYTKSYFSPNQQNSVQQGMDGFRVEGFFNTPHKQDIISCKWKAGKKEILSNGAEYEKLTDHIGKYAAVMIAPDDMELINGGSELRRRWADSILGQTDREYLQRLMHYQRVLLQRNAWLKMQASGSMATTGAELAYYNAQLAEDGLYIYQKRLAFINNFIPLVNTFYIQLSNAREQVSINYESSLSRKNLLTMLEDGIQHDLRMQRTLNGVHKDDWHFMLNDLVLKQFGSQGQKKSFLFALKLAQYHYLLKESGQLPILLLDDIFEKLDQKRMEALLRIISKDAFGQVLLTDTHIERVKNTFGSHTDVGFLNL